MVVNCSWLSGHRRARTDRTQSTALAGSRAALKIIPINLIRNENCKYQVTYPRRSFALLLMLWKMTVSQPLPRTRSCPTIQS